MVSWYKMRPERNHEALASTYGRADPDWSYRRKAWHLDESVTFRATLAEQWNWPTWVSLSDWWWANIGDRPQDRRNPGGPGICVPS